MVSGYVNNQLSLFYKSKLSDVRNRLIEKQDNCAYYVLSDPNKRIWLQQALLRETKRSEDEPLVPKATMTAQVWIREVLVGTSDPFLAQAKNKWADPIEPGTVKGKQAVVVEHRDLPLEMSSNRELKLSTPSDDPDSVVSYLAGVFLRNVEAQKLDG